MADGSIGGVGGPDSEMVQRAVMSNLSRSMVGLMHPGNVTVNSTIYSHEENSTLDTSIYEVRSGIAKVPATALNFQSNINFTLLNRSVVSGLYLTGQITIPQGAVLPSKWFYYALQNIQYGFPGISNFQLNGISMLNLFMRQNPQDRRDELNNLNPGAIGVTGGTAVPFTVPLSYIIGEGFNADKGFYLSGGSLANVMQFSFQFNPAYQWIGSGGVTGGFTGGIVGSLPTQFDSLSMKICSQIDILNQEFDMARMSDIFRIPFSFVTSYPLFQQANAGPSTTQQIQLQALPSAEMTSILVWAVPSNRVGISSINTAVDYSPIKFTYEKLSLQGVDFILLENNVEILTQNNFYSVGDSSGFYYNDDNVSYATSATGTIQYNATTLSSTQKRFTALECFIADPSRCFDGQSKFQLSRNFSGQILTFYYKVPDDLTTAVCPFIDFYFTYLANGIFDVQKGTANLIT